MFLAMPKQKKVFSVLFLLPLFLLAIFVTVIIFSGGLHLLCTKNEPICRYLHNSPPKTETTIFLSIKETIPNSPSTNRTSQSTPKMPRKDRLYLRIIHPNARSKLFAQRAAEFFNSLNLNNASSCNLTFFMTWISPLKYFGARELVAIESLFKSHQNACLLIISSTMDSLKGVKLLKPFLDNGFRVAAFSPDYEYLVSGTPAETWFDQLRKGEVNPGDVSIGQNLSNLVRLLILYKYGGIYLDTDVIVMKSFDGLRNCIGAQTIDAVTHQWSRLNNAVMVFDKKHPLVLEFIREFASTFDGNKWGHNGPYLVSRVVLRVAGKLSSNVTVLPPIAFYPLDWSRIQVLFQGPANGSHTRWMTQKLYWIQKSSFAVHLWNRESKSMRMEQGSIVARILSDCCLFCNSSIKALLH
ncbi:hypothetical protein LUZ62_057640 [Rhynchospora pubera]|uniref:Alpha 1,4-glycosyltransferase domain-containing protein n=1 Tax=Rhynchospora pubera TaxID=906938 RepID=A0AAV8DVB6_9POAL|nr:hypothetical protein LUZ62_057640 [Rhynchospora pubera]